MLTGAAIAVALVVAGGFAVVATEDARTGRVSIRRSQAITVIAVGGLGLLAVIGRSWPELAGAVVGAAIVTAIQLVPYRLQPAGPDDQGWIGRADVRLGLPFGWTLGWFGVGFAIVGFALSLTAGLAVATIGRRPAVRFVPFLAGGLWIALAWALARRALVS